MKKIAFKPLIKTNIPVPETFENLVYARPEDIEIQKTPAVWFTRTGGAIKYNTEKQTLEVGNKYWWSAFPFFFRGSCEVTIPKDYLKYKNGIEIIFRGRGWFSVKLMESTVTEGGVRTYAEGNWQKLDTIREKEFFSLSRDFQTRKIYFNNFYNKPYNVELAAFIRGFRPMNILNIASLEITGRLGKFEIKRLRFFD